MGNLADTVCGKTDDCRGGFRDLFGNLADNVCGKTRPLLRVMGKPGELSGRV
jgi:hypothetical protein